MDGSMHTYYERTLVVSIRDGEADKQVWNGWTTRRLENQDHPHPMDEIKLEKMYRA